MPCFWVPKPPPTIVTTSTLLVEVVTMVVTHKSWVAMAAHPKPGSGRFFQREFFLSTVDHDGICWVSFIFLQVLICVKCFEMIVLWFGGIELSRYHVYTNQTKKENECLWPLLALRHNLNMTPNLEIFSKTSWNYTWKSRSRDFLTHSSFFDFWHHIKSHFPRGAPRWRPICCGSISVIAHHSSILISSSWPLSLHPSPPHAMPVWAFTSHYWDILETRLLLFSDSWLPPLPFPRREPR